MQASSNTKISKVNKASTFIKENTLTSCSFNMADISTSSLAASNWFTLDIEIGIMTCVRKKMALHPKLSVLRACNCKHHACSQGLQQQASLSFLVLDLTRLEEILGPTPPVPRDDHKTSLLKNL
jgi:hypothetical protein